MDKTQSLFLKRMKALLGLGGVVLLFWMMRKIGFQTLSDHLVGFGIFPALMLIFIYGLAQLSFCAGWFVLLDCPGNIKSFWKVFLAYSAGDAVNMTVPSANLAGEPVKVMLIRDQISFESAVSSVTIYKYSDLLSMTLFLVAGWLAHFWFYSFPLSWNIGAGIVGLGMGILCFLLYLLQHRGVYLPVKAWFQRIGWGEWIVNRLDSAHLIDQQISGYVQNHRAKFLYSLFFNFLAWFGGVLEIMIFMKIIGRPASFSAAFTIETFSLFINNVIFFVPARLGVGEGGRVLLFLALGYSASEGMLYGMIRRLREMVWIGFGFCILLFKKKPEKTAVNGK